MAKKSIFGLDENIAGMISYVLAFFSGLVVLVMERENKFVRFHALQSTIWFMFLCIISWVLSIFSRIWVLGFFFGIAHTIVGVIGFVSWAYLIFMAYRGSTFKLPIIGDVVWAQVNK
jgi:uncharacterized membrane protein